MDALSAHALAAYRALVYETPEFAGYFRASTPISEIAELKIGSRPSSRTASSRIEDLRAIPWVFSWGQCRLMLPGWYGFGAAVDAFLASAPDGVALLADMHARWPFFRATMSNMGMVLAKTDLAIASRYAELVPDESVRSAIFGRIRAVHARKFAGIFGDHEAVGASRRQSDACAKHPQPFSVPRSAQSSADRALAPLSCGRDGRANAAGDPPDDQRTGSGPPQQRLELTASLAARPDSVAALAAGFALLHARPSLGATFPVPVGPQMAQCQLKMTCARERTRSLDPQIRCASSFPTTTATLRRASSISRRRWRRMPT
jgi:hypothetical protein